MSNETLEKRYSAISEELEQWDHNPCDCNSLELKIREFGGGVHYVKQCNNCGRQKGGSIKKADALVALNGCSPRAFDPTIEELYDNQYKTRAETWSKLWKEKMALELEMSGRPTYSFPNFHEIQEKKDKAKEKLMTVVSAIAEEFGETSARQILMRSLVDINKQKYLENVKNTERFSDEGELKRWLVNNLSIDFDFYAEVWGRHLAENINVRVDFIAVPKAHLVENGFDPSPFAIEVKYIRQEEGFTRKSSRAFWQTISYNDSEFNLNGHIFKPKFSILFTNLAFQQEMDLVRNYGWDTENDVMEWEGMLHLANHANVGLFHITGQKEKFCSWRIKFAGGTYFSYGIDNNGERSGQISNSDVINKVRVGNF
ncbi:TPA: hypothetical protein ACGU7E_004557 [Vibrio vulnificus]|uniref:hypothetical protein n=1 Tax=Vibrio vulnificus TaxID=672 RepID=UPI001034B128|nr:hypothetical protein [Vibrio vulnificus]QBH26991.1 hypothetical protein FORC77_1268 [Vibrio vulnificus]HAS8348982.1 hypothetical protein [Vibrio vulnificus]HAS8510983.1 hypothetical protein [Vibrio vulnificus]HDY8187626.1 hypothetical protein [Vibrio vulnificus]